MEHFWTVLLTYAFNPYDIPLIMYGAYQWTKRGYS